MPLAAGPAGPRALETPGVRVLYPEGQEDAAHRCAAAARATIERLGGELGLAGVQPITLSLYSRHVDFSRAVGIPKRQPVVGIATGRGTEAYVDTSVMGTDVRAVVAHEVAHLMLAQATGAADMPHWFDEGFAEHVAGSLPNSHRTLLQQQSEAGGLFALAKLSGTFPREGPEATLAYAQSHALVSYILAGSPAGALKDLAGRLRRGDAFAPALEAATGRPAAAWDAAWRRAFQRRFDWYPWLTAAAGASGLVMVLLCVLAYRAVKRRKARLPDDLW